MKPILFAASVYCGISLLWSATTFAQAPAAIANDPAAAIRHKLETIIVPHLELHDATLSDAVEQLREQSRQLDPDPNPDTRGINIFVKIAAPAPGATPQSAHVTLAATKLPILEALGRVAAQVGMKVKIEPYAVSLVPLSEQSDPMTTAQFHLPPDVFGFPSGGMPSAPPAGSVPHHDAKDFLESKGVTFPPGASATYLPTVQKLVVRNTHENVEKMNALFASAATIAPKSP